MPPADTFGVGLLSLLCAVACSTWLLMQREVALIATMLLLGTCYALITNAMRIFKKFELREGEVVRVPRACAARESRA